MTIAPSGTVTTVTSGPDRRAPLATFTSKLRMTLRELLRRGVAATVVSDENATASVRLALEQTPRPGQTVPKRIVIGTARKALKAGVRSKLIVKLTKKGKARLRKARRTAKLSLRVSVRDAAGNTRYPRPRALRLKK